MRSSIKKRGGLGFVFLFIFALVSAISAAGQTPQCDVTWRKTDNPRIISGIVTIPATQTVCAEAGVRVQFSSNGELQLYGNLYALGTAAEPVVFDVGYFPNRIRVRGTLDVRFGDIAVPFELNPGSTILVRNSRFREHGSVHTVTFLPPSGFQSKYLLVEDSVFDSNSDTQGDEAHIYVSKATVVLRNVTLRRGGHLIVGESNLFFNNITAENLKYYALELQQYFYQPQFLDTLFVTNSPQPCISTLTGNYFIGQNTTLQGCQYPVKLVGGLVPGSRVPITGNQNNWIETAIVPESVYAPLAAPYVTDGGSFGQTEMMPGTTFKLRANGIISGLSGFGGTTGVVRTLGLPDAPIRFEPFVPGQNWQSLSLSENGDKMEYIHFEGMQFGIRSLDQSSTNYYIDQSVFRNNINAVLNPFRDTFNIEGSLFTNNTTAIDGTGGNASDVGSLALNGVTNPNLFENNNVAVRSTSPQNPFVPFNWWNSPTGPTTTANPGGTGEIIQGIARFQPFRTVAPDRTDHPPVVRLKRRPFYLNAGNVDGVYESGQKIILHWDAFDNSQIVKQKIQIQKIVNNKSGFMTVADNLPPNQRSFEFMMPGEEAKVFVRIVAVDETGQEGWDEFQVFTFSQGGTLQLLTPVGGQTFRGGTELDLDWQITSPFPNNDFSVYLVLDGNRKILIGANGNQNGTFGTIKLPLISTDSARLAISNVYSKRFYSEPFSIRPDARYPDAPPTVSMSSPNAGQTFPAGGIVPIAWTAADDEAIRQFNILYSTDSGKTWLTLAENLPPTATSFNWHLPPGTGFTDVRVRVVAIDKRFQNSSDGYNRSFSIVFNQPNAAPSVRLTQPANNATINQGDSLLLTADAHDADGSIRRVEFYDNNILIGTDTTAPYAIGYNYSFEPTTSGIHTITARAIDDLENGTTSAPANFTIIDNDPGPAPLPAANASVALPRDGTNFPTAPATITVTAHQTASANQMVRADFFLNTTFVGTDTTAPFEFTLTNVPAGSHSIFIRSTASNGTQFFSRPVHITVGANATAGTKFDFDGDGKADISIFRPAGGEWWMQHSSGGIFALQFGSSTDKIVPGDYTGDGKTDVAIWRPSTGEWFILRSEDGSFYAFPFGTDGDVPAPADYDGDGKTDAAVFRPSNSVWYIQKSSGGVSIQTFGQTGDTPVAADYDGDGKTDIAIFRPQSGEWWIQRSTAGLIAFQLGNSTDKPVPGDYTGDGKADAAFYRPATGEWFVLRSENLSFYSFPFGTNGDAPVPGDYDGDGKTDAAVFRPSNSTWFIQRTTAGILIQQFGSSGDKAIPNAFVP